MAKVSDHVTHQLAFAVWIRLKRQAAPPVPEAGRLLWTAFHDLSRGRGWRQLGRCPIAMVEIQARAELARLPLQHRHVRVILALDEAFLDHAHAAATPKWGETGAADLQPREHRRAL